MQIEIKGHILDIDKNATIDYYSRNSICNCTPCRNFLNLIKNMYLDLDNFLMQFGVDILRPDENFWWESDQKAKTVCYTPVYTVNGKMEFSEIELYVDNIRIVINNAYVPNENTEPYFVITAFNIILPWKIDEPYEESFPMQKNRQPILKRFLKRKQ